MGGRMVRTCRCLSRCFECGRGRIPSPDIESKSFPIDPMISDSGLLAVSTIALIATFPGPSIAHNNVDVDSLLEISVAAVFPTFVAIFVESPDACGATLILCSSLGVVSRHIRPNCGGGRGNDWSRGDLGSGQIWTVNRRERSSVIAFDSMTAVKSV